MSDFDAARKRLERLCALVATYVPCQDDMRLLLDKVREQAEEIERLKEGLRLAGDVQIAYREAWDKWQRRAEKAEAEVERLRKEVPTASQEVWRAEANKQVRRAEKAEAELVAERERADRLDAAVSVWMGASSLSDCEACAKFGAALPPLPTVAAPEPTPSEEKAIYTQGVDGNANSYPPVGVTAGSEQPDHACECMHCGDIHARRVGWVKASAHRQEKP